MFSGLAASIQFCTTPSSLIVHHLHSLTLGCFVAVQRDSKPLCAKQLPQGHQRDRPALQPHRLLHHLHLHRVQTGSTALTFATPLTNSLLLTPCTRCSYPVHQVKFQYMQSYLMYDGLRAGFCSTFTTFGNLIEDTGRLILSGTGSPSCSAIPSAPSLEPRSHVNCHSGMWWLSFINLFATFILSFCVWEAGRFVARRWKGGVAYRYACL